MVKAPDCSGGRFEPVGESLRKLRLIICDDHRMITEMLTATLAPDYDVVGVAFDGEALLALVRRQPADCLLLDLFLPKQNGIELIPILRVIQPSMEILALTMVVDRATAAAAFAVGARGFLTKDCSVDELRHAVGEVLARRRYLSPLVPKNTQRVGLRAAYPALCNLTERQEQILAMMGDGECESAIAHALGVTPAAITLQKQNLARILGLHSGASLKQFALRIGRAMDAGRRWDGRWRAGSGAPRR
jgi:DNA-binding NarL/FixJ family response regulator